MQKNVMSSSIVSNSKGQFVTPKDMSKTQCVIPLSLSYKKLPPQVLGALRANNLIIFKTSLCMGSERKMALTPDVGRVL